MNTLEMMKSACGISAVSGRENMLFSSCFMSEAQKKLGAMRTDPLGNVYFDVLKGNGGKHFLLEAHLDQVGFIVTEICDGGFLHVSPIGMPDTRTLYSAPVTVFGKKEVYGIFSTIPPHLQSENDSGRINDISDLYIDTGLLNAGEIISIGDTAVFEPSCCELSDGKYLSATSIDDRSGVVCILRACEKLKSLSKDISVTAVFASREEVGGMGAATAAFEVSPTHAIAVDVSFGDTPDNLPRDCAVLGSGAMIGISPFLCREMTDGLIKAADKNNIPYTCEIMGGRTGTDADRISITKSGVKTALISIPIRYMHTPIEMVCISDIDNCSELIYQYIRQEAECK